MITLRPFRILLVFLVLCALTWTLTSNRLAPLPQVAAVTSVLADPAATTSIFKTDVPARASSLTPLPAPVADAALSAQPPADVFAAFDKWSESFVSAVTAEEKADLLIVGKKLAAERRLALLETIKADPQRALELAVPFSRRHELPAAIVEQLEKVIDGQGFYGVIGILAQAPDSATTSAFIRTAKLQGDAQEYRAYVYGRRLEQKTKENIPLHGIAIGQALALSESPVRVLQPDEAAALIEAGHGADAPVCPISGQTIAPTDQIAVDAGTRIVYLCHSGHIAPYTEELVARESATGETGATGSSSVIAQSAYTTGAKTVLIIRVRFADQGSAYEPQTLSSATTMMAGVNTFMGSNSWGAASTVATITPVYALPNTEQYYKDNDTSGYAYNVLSDARLVAANPQNYTGNTGLQAYDYTQYGFEAVRYNGGPGGFSGQAYVGGRGCWLKSSSEGVADHEFGHNYGLWHANFWTASTEDPVGQGSNNEYGDPYDTMGGAGGGNQHYSAYEKSVLDWLPAANISTVTAATSGSYRIYAHDLGGSLNSAALYALKVKKDTRDFWIDFRQNSGVTNNRWWFNGVSLRFGAWANSEGGAQWIDTTQGTPDGKDDGSIVIGRTFADKAAGIYITPTGKGGTTPQSIDVVVNVGMFPSNLTPGLSIGASATAVATGTTVNFSATASDPNGDTLAYYWDFGDKNFGTNSAAASKSWSTAGEYVVRCTVSDMKGGTASASIIVSVGNVSTYRISGTITGPDGDPLSDVRIHNGLSSSDPNYRYTYSNSDGSYTLVNLATGSYAVGAATPSLSLTAMGFANPVIVGPNRTAINFVASQALRSISGKVTDNNVGIANVLVTDGIRTERTNSSGDFTLSGVPDGSYTLTTSKPGYSFTPNGFSNPVTVAGGALTNQNFTTQGFTIIGTINGVASTAQVTVSDGYHTTTSYQSGRGGGASNVYYLWPVSAGTWNLRASVAGTSFSPANFTNPLTVSGPLSAIDFTADASGTYTISGTITHYGEALAGVSISAGSATGVTDSRGGYYLKGLTAGNYTLTPSSGSYTFSPATRNISISSADLTSQHFATAVTDTPPTVASPAAALLNSATKASAALNVLGADDRGELYLNYTWATTGTPPAAVSFSINNSHSAQSTVASFTKPGSYNLQATIRDSANATVTSSVTVIVPEVSSYIALSPSGVTLATGSSQQFTASLVNQFGGAFSIQPPFSWAVSGGGTVDSAGLFSATTSGANFQITASADGKSGLASFSVSAPDGPGGGITREWWNAISGSSVSNLTSNSRFPDSPDGVEVLTNLFETPANFGDNYGQRVRGNFIAPLTGNYIFVIASDDNSELWLSTTANPANKVKIASISGATSVREWNRFSSQVSTAIPLQAGQRYYIEALHKEGTGGDNLAVGVTLPGGVQERPIPYHRLEPVNQVLTSVAVTPASATVSPAATQQYTAIAKDQFGAAMVPQPTLTWAVSGGGNISPSGLFTAGTTVGGPFTVTASTGVVSGSAAVSVAQISTLTAIADTHVRNGTFAAENYGADTELRLKFDDTSYERDAYIKFDTSPVADITSAKIRLYSPVNTITNGANNTDSVSMSVYAVADTSWLEGTGTVGAPGTGGLTWNNKPVNATTALATIVVKNGQAKYWEWDVSAYVLSERAAGHTAVAFLIKNDAKVLPNSPYFPFNSKEASSNKPQLALEFAPANTAPTITSAAAATPATVTGTTTALSVLGADDAGEPALTYTWATTGTPPAPVSFNANANNQAKNTTATFTKAGTYNISVTILDAGNLSTSAGIGVTVDQSLTALAVTPLTAAVLTGASRTFTCTALDQFGQTMNPPVSWTVSGGGSISSAGLFTATSPGGPYTVNATSGAFSATASVSVYANFSSWMTAFPSLTGNSALATADPDGDGWNNLLEYAFSANPTVAATPNGPVVGTETAGASSYLTLTFDSDITKTDLLYQVQVAADLVSEASWSNVSDSVMTTSGSIQHRKASVLMDGTRKFFRLKVTAP